MSEDEYVYARKEVMVKVKIPQGSIKCPECKGSGEFRKYYGPPGDRGQFTTCPLCGGAGFQDEDIVKEHEGIWKLPKR